MEFKFQAEQYQSVDMQWHYLMHSCPHVTQSENARNSLPCYFAVQYAALGGKPEFNYDCVVTTVTTIPKLFLCHPLWL